LAILQQKISTFRSYLEDFSRARSLGYFKGRDDVDAIYQEFVEVHADFRLRGEILSSNLLHSIFLLLTCGNILSFDQKRHLLVKKLKGQEKKVSG
jgi:hypothetical protein